MSAVHFALTLTSGAVGAVTGGVVGFRVISHTSGSLSGIASVAPIFAPLLLVEYMGGVAIGSAVGGSVGFAVGYFGFESVLTSDNELVGNCNLQESDF